MYQLRHKLPPNKLVSFVPHNPTFKFCYFWLIICGCLTSSEGNILFFTAAHMLVTGCTGFASLHNSFYCNCCLIFNKKRRKKLLYSGYREGADVQPDPEMFPAQNNSSVLSTLNFSKKPETFTLNPVKPPVQEKQSSVEADEEFHNSPSVHNSDDCFGQHLFV